MLIVGISFKDKDIEFKRINCYKVEFHKDGIFTCKDDDDGILYSIRDHLIDHLNIIDTDEFETREKILVGDLKDILDRAEHMDMNYITNALAELVETHTL